MFAELTTTQGNPTTRSLNATPDIGKTLAAVIIAGVLFVAALILYLNEEDTAAASFFAVGEAVLTGGLGIAVGEVSGANAAAAKLTVPS
jgi:hypothetical protein